MPNSINSFNIEASLKQPPSQADFNIQEGIDNDPIFDFEEVSPTVSLSDIMSDLESPTVPAVDVDIPLEIDAMESPTRPVKYNINFGFSGGSIKEEEVKVENERIQNKKIKDFFDQKVFSKIDSLFSKGFDVLWNLSGKIADLFIKKE